MPADSDDSPAARLDNWAAIQLLADPARRGIFEKVRSDTRPVTRDEVAAAVGVSRSLAAFHLDKLAGAGLLAVSYARPPGKRGPGAGRPAKRYGPTTGQIEVSLPARRYDVAGRVLARAVASTPRGEDVRARAAAIAAEDGRALGVMRRHGRRLGVDRTMAVSADALAALGYEPAAGPRRHLRLRNCPFHALAVVEQDLICGLNRELVRGLLDGLNGAAGVTAELDGQPGDCCVTVSHRAAAGS